MEDDVITTETRHTGRLGDTVVNTVSLSELFEPNTTSTIAYMPIDVDPPWDLSLDAGNYITCEGDLPSFPLPQPYLVSDFQNSTQLCAVQWSGGLSYVPIESYRVCSDQSLTSLRLEVQTRVDIAIAAIQWAHSDPPSTKTTSGSLTK